MSDRGSDTMARLTTELTTDHPSSSYGIPVLVCEDGTALGPIDLMPYATIADWPEGPLQTAVEWVEAHADEFDSALVAKFTRPSRAYLGY
jgi:hypothetical protein